MTPVRRRRARRPRAPPGRARGRARAGRRAPAGRAWARWGAGWGGGGWGGRAGAGKPVLGRGGRRPPGPRRWKAAVIGRYLDGENALADGLQDAFGPGQLNLADRGFFSMDRWTRFSGTGADLLWRVKNGAKSLPFRTLHVLQNGSQLGLLR